MTKHELETLKMRAQAAEQNGSHYVPTMEELIHLTNQALALLEYTKPGAQWTENDDYWRGYDEGFKDGESVGKKWTEDV